MNIKHLITSKFAACINPLFLIVMITLIFGTIYTVGQQIIRMGANDPQIQYAEDLTHVLSAGMDPVPLLSAFFPQKIDVSESLAPYIIVYNEQGGLTVSSVTLHGKNLLIPQGVLDYVRTHGEDRITWQQEKGARSAVVVSYFNNKSAAKLHLASSTANPTSGFIVVGRSLREIEARESNLLYTVAFAWLLSIVGIIGKKLLTKWL